jgi:hypothetical protein
MIELSKLSTCPLKALPVQLPFHMYEDNVYKLLMTNKGGEIVKQRDDARRNELAL